MRFTIFSRRLIFKFYLSLSLRLTIKPLVIIVRKMGRPTVTNKSAATVATSIAITLSSSFINVSKEMSPFDSIVFYWDF